jgi:hypothetical protein
MKKNFLYMVLFIMTPVVMIGQIDLSESFADFSKLENISFTASEDVETFTVKEFMDSDTTRILNACTNRRELRDEVRRLLSPYRYSSSKISVLSFYTYPKQYEVVVPIYYDYDHKMIFSTKGLPEDVKIRVYELPKRFDNREPIYEANEQEGINEFYVPQDYNGYKLFLEYTAPPVEKEFKSDIVKGCIIFMLGYIDPELIPEETTVTTEKSSSRSSKPKKEKKKNEEKSEGSN